MLLRRKIFLTLILLGFFLCKGYAQTESISGIINDYASITAIRDGGLNAVDTLVVSGLVDTAWDDGDTVMVYVVRGSGIELEESEVGNDDIGRVENPRYAGKYAFVLISEIIQGPVDTLVVLNADLSPQIGTLIPGDLAQLIRVRSYKRAVVAGEVYAPSWNGASGGVVCLFVTTTLTLNADINVTGRGFKGANWDVLDELYQGDCSSTNPSLYDSLYYQMNPVYAGRKGEAITTTLFETLRGKGRNINGGGGGNGKLSGGGGGANYAAGGQGGEETEECSPAVPDQGGIGGYPLHKAGGSFYVNKDPVETPLIFNRYNRIFFGGGGGAGVQVSGVNNSPGANGGGVVVIVADTIDGNDIGRIIANGNDVSTTVNGAGGGGGAGGGIILDVSGYKNNPRLYAVGGKGGNTNNASNASGPGGGGGGGIYWLAGDGDQGLSMDESQGQPGRYTPTNSTNGAEIGGKPNWKDGLEAPLRGFLFNTVPTEFWVCSDQVPEPIIASKPKGGTGTYAYTWIDSSSTQNQWQLVAGATDSILEFTVPLSDTNYYRRIVREVPQTLPADTSFRIAMYVHQAIENNTIAAPDTVCRGLIPEAFVSVGLPTKGDNVNYDYLWQKDEGSGVFEPAEEINNQPGYAPSELDVTTVFRRVVTSGGICVDTTAILKVEVFAPISGNVIADNDTICWNTVPDLITQNPDSTLGGGDPDPTNWRYRWESSAEETGLWNEIAGETTSSYQPTVLTATIWYRRVVLSGNDDACVDPSKPVVVLNVPVITGNEITSADQTVCTDDLPQLVQATTPGGGIPDEYDYLWESRTETTSWVAADNTNGNDQRNYMPPIMTGDTTEYRRVVMSGGTDGACKDTSLSKTINVLPAIDNNTISTTVTVNCQLDDLSILNGTVPGGGATEAGVDPTRKYRWEEATGTGVPGVFGEISYGPDELNYTDMPRLSLSEDYWYRRIVLSGPSLGGQAQVCTSTSDTIHIVLHTAISNNEIDPADSVCFNAPKELIGKLPAGEGSEPISYLWKDIDSGAELGTGKDLNYTFTTLDPRQFNRIVVIGECEDTSNTMPITVMELPGGILSGDLPKACEKDALLDVDLNIEGLSNYITPWEISLDDGVNPELSDQQELSADGPVTVSLSTDEVSTQYNYTLGKILYRLTDGTECLAPTANLTGNVPIEVFLTPEPVISVSTELTDDAVCDNEVSLVVDPDHGTGTWESDNPGKLGFLPDAQALSVRASLDPSDQDAWAHLPYKIFFKSEAGDCSGSDTVEISFYEQPEDANAGPDDTIYLTNTVTLSADPPTAGMGTWTIASGSGDIEDANDPNTLVTGLAKGERNEFTWTIVNGICSTSDDRSVITQDEAQPYEGFSPNGDQVNDYFIIRGLADATDFSMSIFDALGNTVRTVKKANVGEIVYDPGSISGGLRDDELVIWDGRSNNGNIVAAGTYYYVLNVTMEQDDGSTDKPQKKHYIVVGE
ncbi:MAG: gliding motility-associated C-terminal domain-containing protein [Bacteroides sp.]|nr:gliding motility-associated C-terminal domain-containing protein [Bacteroides sp.]